jgi:hypothetical protein
MEKHCYMQPFYSGSTARSQRDDKHNAPSYFGHPLDERLAYLYVFSLSITATCISRGAQAATCADVP